MFKKCKVVMLPTNEKASIWKCSITNRIYFIACNYSKDSKYQHLYIISEDKIENGDWCYFKGIVNNDYIFKAENIYNNNGLIHTGTGYHKLKDCCKIIATTNSSLKWSDDNDIQIIDYHFAKLPQPTQSFIEMYVEEYNKDNVITDVLVEYEIDIYAGKPNTKFCYPKVNPKDNTITIKKVKDSWNREEHIEGMWEAYKASNTIFEDEDALKQEFNNWVENLKL